MFDKKQFADLLKSLDVENLDELPYRNLSEDAHEYLYMSGYHLYQSGKFSEARDFFKFLTLSNPFNTRHWMALAATHQMLKEYTKAIDCYSIVALKDPTNPYIHLHAAECFFMEGNKDQGLKALSSALEVSGGKPAYEKLYRAAKLMQESWM